MTKELNDTLKKINGIWKKAVIEELRRKKDIWHIENRANGRSPSYQ